MSPLTALVLLQARPEPSLWEYVPLLVGLFAIFYFFLIRPQSQRQRQHDQMLKAISRGDTVVTAGGIHGKVTGVTDDVLTLEVAVLRGERVRLKVDRAKIERRVEPAKKEREKEKSPKEAP